MLERRKPLPRTEPEIPERIGRLEPSRVLGRGGMGVVYLAWDPKLQRDVAVKLLSDTREPAQRQYMRDEARAMARLSHPNVVQVFATGMHDDAVFIAMELVQGVTLARWQRDNKHTWRETLDAYLQAGAGLAAAHAVALIHGDFKPHNVMVGNDARVRVLDFGLARLVTPDDARYTGRVMGTAPYMAPEMHAGETASARSDQFAYCVALYEALYGARPFESKRLRGALQTRGPLRLPPAPPDTSVPRWLRRIIEVGLRRSPAARWRSMDALLRALRTRGSYRRRVGLAAVALAVPAALAVSSFGPSVSACSAPATRLDGAWGEQQRRALRGEPAKQAEPLARRFDTYAQRWVAVYRNACSADAQVGDPQLACLALRRHELASLSARLAHPQGLTLASIASAVETLSAPETCAHAHDRPWMLAAREHADEAQHVRERLAQIAPLIAAGTTEGAVRPLRVALADAERLQDDALAAEVSFALGHAHHRRADYSQAATDYERTYFLARRSHHDALAGLAAARMAWTLGLALDDAEAGLLWGEHARAEVGGRGGAAESSYLSALGRIHHRNGQYDEARGAFEQALAVDVVDGTPTDLDVAGTMLSYGFVLADDGYPEEAIAYQEWAVATVRDTLGEAHPVFAGAINSLGISYEELEHLEIAAALYLRATAIWRASLGSLHPETGMGYANLAKVRRAQGQLPLALKLNHQSLEIWEREFGPGHSRVSGVRRNLAAVLMDLGRHQDAVRQYELAIASLEASHGPQHPTTQGVVGHLTELRATMGYPSP